MTTNSTALVPLPEIQKMAEAVVKSGLFQGVKSVPEAMTMMMLCQAEGRHPMQVMSRYDLIKGRPAKKARTLLSDFQEAGGKVEWLERTDSVCEAVFHSPGLIKPVRVRVTFDEMKRAGLTGKDNYRNYPRRMLTARCISEGVGIAWAPAHSMHTPEEVEDMPAVDYEPPEDMGIDIETGEVPDENTREPMGDDDVEVFKRVRDGKETIWVPNGYEPKHTPEQLKKLHALYREIGVDEDYRRQRLGVMFGKSSSADLSKREASELIEKVITYQQSLARRDDEAVANLQHVMEREQGEEG